MALQQQCNASGATQGVDDRQNCTPSERAWWRVQKGGAAQQRIVCGWNGMAAMAA
jgi:hypothetical protein